MITIDWATKVISIPQSYLTNLGGGVYELDTDQFRLDLKDLEDSEVGMSFLDTHNHIAPISLGGVTLARVIEIINGYTITFEDLQYAVNLSGSNNNIAVVTNVNQVSIRSFNSAGLIQVSSGSGVTAQDKLDIADRVWDEVAASHVTVGTFGKLVDTVQALLDELHKLQGLDIANPMTVTPTTRTAGSINLTLTGDGETTTTVTRQP